MSEPRLDRLERLAKLFVRAGIRYRRDLRELGGKLKNMDEMQNKNDEWFARNEKISARHEERLVALSEKTDQRFMQLADSLARTNGNLAELIKIVRKGPNGSPQTESQET